LVELVVTASVLAVALLATAGAVARSAALSRSAAQTRAFARVAASVLEEVRGTRFDRVVSTFDNVQRTFNDIPGAGTGATATITVQDAGSGSTRWPVLRVVVRVAWQGPTGPEEYSAATFVCDRNADGSGSSVSGTGTNP
jgi:type II secretory pathway pseudopilin PulG